MKKTFHQIALWEIVTISALALLGLILGSFFDLQISKAIVDTNNSFGAFIETYGATLGYGMIPIGGTLCFLGLFPRPRLWQKILGIFLVLLAIGLSSYLLGDSFTTSDTSYGFTVTSPLSYGLATLFMLLFSVFTIVLTDKRNLDLTLRIGVVIIVAILIQYLIVTLFKSLNCRPRYRFIYDSNLNTENETFRAWYQFTPFKYHGDAHKSFPSGHTAQAGMVLLLASMSPILRFRFKRCNYVLFGIGLIYTLLVAYSRVRYGAHFLSDVSVGLFIAVLSDFLSCYLLRFKEEKKNEVEVK